MIAKLKPEIETAIYAAAKSMSFTTFNTNVVDILFPRYDRTHFNVNCF